MTIPTTADLLKFADLQMAAEAFLKNEQTDEKFYSGANLEKALVRGNDHTSKFTAIQATEFAAHWEVLDQKANTSTGFSGTLFRNKDTNELVMSFRSTEFIDDAARDNQATNSFEIKDTGFAWGQLTDMESWYAELKTGGKLPVGANFSVTGYSLGGHLATAFNLLHPDAAQQVVTFNGAGVGKVKFATDSLAGLLQEFKSLRDDPSQIDARFTDPQLRDIYQSLRDILAPAAWNLAPVTEKYYLLDQAQSLLNGYTLPSNPDNSNPQFPSLVQERGFITDALKEIRTLVVEAERVGTLVAGGGENPTSNPVRVSDEDIEAENLDYRMAVKLLAQKSQSASLLNGAQQAFGSKVYLDGYETSPKANQFDIVADSSPSMVSNSQWHIGQDIRIFIEKQPLYRGGIVGSVVDTSLDYGNISLLVDGYFNKDFGDTHSLVLLVDSLNVQNALMQLIEPSGRDAAVKGLKGIFEAASNLREQNGDLTSGNGQGKADGNVLESVLNALGSMVMGAQSFEAFRLKGSPNGNTWANVAGPDGDGYTGRNQFYKTLKEIQDKPAYTALAGHVQLVATPVNGQSARQDFGALLSLVYLSPFALKFDGAIPGALQSAQQALYDDWVHDKDLTAPQRLQGQAHIRDEYLNARANFLTRVNYYNSKNARYDTSSGGVLPEDADATLYDQNSPDIVWSDRSEKITIQRGGVTASTQYVVFGGKGAEADIEGGSRDDRLFGGGGNDTLSGKSGNDYLQGDAGDDTLIGGDGNDTLVGGKDSDTYQFAGAFGKDIVLDSDSKGEIKIDGHAISDARAAVKRDTWAAELAPGQTVEMSVYNDADSSTGKKLVITRAGSTDNTVTIKNFDLEKAKSSEGYLGIKLDPTTKLAFKEGGGTNLWSDPGFNPGSLAGKVSSLVEGAGKTFTIYLNVAAKADESLVLSLAGLAGKGLKAILGDSKVDADGATITLAEGQTEVSFALVQDGELDADATGAIGVSYHGIGQSVVGNTWGLSIKDLGETTKTFNGDQHGRFIGSTVENGVTLDYYAATEWAADGQVIDGEAEEDFNDVIAGSIGNDKMSGKGGNDALDGGAGNDEINGDAGDDVIIGGAGSDTLNGGDGNDFIFGAGDLMAPQTVRTHGWSPTLANVGVAGTSDDASDVIDAGDGNDVVFAGRGGDRIEGGAGNDQLWGLAGDDIIEGGSGDDALYGDGINASGSHATTLANDHGNDFLDGGDGNDVILGYGKDDSLFGGAGNDSLWGDAVASQLAGEYHGNDYLDGEDGDDRLWGNGGKDTLYGGDGNDELQGDASGSALAGQYHGDDYLDGEGGDDHLWGDGGNDTLYGGDGDDMLSGDAGGSELAGEYHGDDYVDGGEGNDFLWGGGGSDTLIGGAGNDEIYADTGVLISDAGYLAGEYHGDDSIDAGDGDDYAEGNGGNDSLKGGAGSDQLWGDAALVKLEAEFHGTDFLDGGDGDDYLTGGGKSDTLYGGAGNDFLWGDDSGEEGDDHYIPGSFHGDDYLDGGEGDDQLVGDGGNDTLIGGAGKDKLFGDDSENRLAGEFHGEDYLEGGDGDDYAEGGGNDDTILGGKGDDILWGDADESKISLELHGDDYLDGDEGADKLYGGGGDDILLGGDGNDTLYGDSGDDRLEGGAGDDILMGGDGDDTLIDTEGNNTFDGGTGDDTINVGDQDNNLQGGEGNDTLIAGDGDNTLNGGSGADQLTAGDGDNTMNGDGGNDTITSGSGDDILNGGEGNDSLSAGDGNNTLSGDGGNDTITSGSGDDILNGGEGNDSLSAGDGNNTLSGDGGNDTITSGSGNDALNGGEGNDVLAAGDGNNTVQGGNGNDSLTSGAGTDNLGGGNGNDTLHAGGGNDVLSGGDGDDMVYGEGGDDMLYASYGNDTLAGGDGLDTYVLGYSADRNTVLDDSAEGSVIKLGSAGMKFEDLYAVRRANDLVVEVRGTSASMRIKDYYASTQTSWVFEDAEGNTSTGEALVAASQTDWAQLQENLLKDFQSSALGSISRSYSDSGYTQRVDGSWYLAANYTMGMAKTYDVRTEHSKDVHTPVDDPSHPWATTSSYVSYAEWATQQWGQETARDWTATISFQANAITSGTGAIQSSSYATSIQNAWSAVQWTGDGGTHSESPWELELTSIYSTETVRHYTRYDLDSDYYEGTVGPLTFQDPGAAAQAGDLPDYVAVDFLHQQYGYNLGPSLLADGDQTVWADSYAAVIGGIGNNTIYGAGFAYGGTGNAQLIGGGTLMAGTGDQYLENGRIMVVGDGHDTVVGGGQILVNPDNLGIDLISQGFDPESEIDNLGQSREIKAIYEAMGFGDWKTSYQHGGQFNLVFGEGFGKYYDSIEDARAAFVPSEYWPTFDIAMADPYTTWRYVEPLTALYKTPYTSVEDPANGLVASGYYAAHGITATLLTATDFATLQPLIDAELLFSSVITFGPGLVLGDLTLSWGEAVAPLDGVTHVTLDILWGPDQGIRILMPRSGDALNSVAQQFEFADGTVSTLLDLIALAPPAPDFDTGYARIFSGMGEQTADAADVAGIRAAVASAGELKIESDGVDLLISIIGSSGDSLRISGWYADSSAMPQAILFTSGGAVLSATEMTGKGLIKDGSAGDLDLLGVPGFATTFIAGPNTRMTGNSGMDIYVYNAGSGEVHITDPGGGAVRFGSGVSATATLGLGEGSLVIKLGDQGDIIHLENFDPNDAENFSSVLDFEFADGSVLNLQDLIGQGFDLTGTSDADTITGTSVTDRMLAGAGDDVLQGGRGDDTLDGGAGSDVYLFGRGDGLDTINEDDSTAGNVDTIRFDDSVNVADVRVSREGLNLYLSTDGSTDRIEISNWFADGADTVEQVEFADGTVWSKADLEARLPTLVTGTEGDDEQLSGSGGFDVLDGRGGNDVLEGGAGNDVYLFKRGDGQDIIDDYDETVGNVDAVRFDAGISAADVRVTFDSSGHLFLGIDGTQDRIQLDSWFEGEAYQVERVLFADGTVWNQVDLEAMAVFGPSEGRDYLEGTEDGDFLMGLGGADELYGQGGNDVIDGGSGDDYLDGGDGDDLLAGGTGDDILVDGAGNDVYMYSRGDGSDRIYDYDETVGNVDTLRFYDGTIAAADITVTRGNLDLYLQINGTSDRIALNDWFGAAGSRLERIEFADGTVWDGAMLESLVTLAPATEGNDVLYGTEASEVFSALAGDDELYGKGGNDTLDGGAGNDYLEGGTGNDVYLFGRGSGNDEISDYDETAGNIDTVRFDATVAVSDIRLTRDSSSLFLTIEGTSDRIALDGWFLDEAHQIEIIEFADGTVWNRADVDALPIVFAGTDGDDMLAGTDGADVIDGGAGNDILNGGAGNDVYLYTRGDGSDTINEYDPLAGNADTLRFDSTVTVSDVQVTRSGNNLYLGINGTADRITLTEWFGNGDRRIEQVEFADGTVWGTSALSAMAVFMGTAGDDVIMGSMLGDVFDGGAGNDTLYGNAGNDVYLYKRGDGSDTIGESDDTVGNVDTIRFGDAVLANDVKITRDAWHLYLHIEGTADVITVKNWFFNDRYRIEQIEFADGTVWDKAQVTALVAAAVITGTSGDDYLWGTGDADTMEGGAGNDTLRGDNGNDVYLYKRGDGTDTITDHDATAGNVDTVRFDGSVAVADINVTRDQANLYLNITGTTDRIILNNWFDSDADKVERVEFADGTIWNQSDLLDLSIVRGTAGDDSLSGTWGDDILQGQGGNDLLNGGIGNDVYLYRRGDGSDTIAEDDANAGNVDTVRFDNSVAASDVKVTRDQDHLYLNISGTSDRITLRYWFANDAFKIEQVQFADGTVWGASALAAMAVFGGTAGDDLVMGSILGDVIDGGAGNDSLNGNIGNDVYLYKRGDGSDIITEYDTTAGNIDTLRFDSSVVASDIRFNRDGWNLYLSIDGTTDVIRLGYWYLNDAYKIEQVEFADGTLWNKADFAAMAAAVVFGGTDGNNYIEGTGGDNVLEGGGGNDQLRGLAGNDVYLYKLGDGTDTIFDHDESAGNIDTVRFDSSVAVADIRVSRDQYNLYLNIAGTTDRIILNNWFDSDADKVERVEFADGTVWNQSDLLDLSIVRGTAGDDSLSGTGGQDILQGQGGNDLLNGGIGNDVYLYGRGDGSDTIAEDDANAGNVDTVRFDNSVAASDVKVTRDQDHLYLNISGTSDRITLRYWFANDAFKIEQVQFADGTVWGASALAAMAVFAGTAGDDSLAGSALDDVIDGGTGNDGLNGGFGNDVYLYRRGDGFDTINEYDATAGNIDTVRFDSSVAAGDVKLGRNYSHLYLRIDGTADVIMLKNWFYNDAYKIEQVEFADGTVWNKADFAAMANEAVFDGTQDDDNLMGFEGNDILKGFGGNDSLYGAGGFDVLEGGAGEDSLADGSGSNYLNGGAGRDYLSGSAAAADLFIGGTGNDVLNLGNGKDLIAFNVGDGQDTVYASGASVSPDDTVSLGGVGLDYAKLSLEKSGNDLILKISDTDQLTFTYWYGSTANQSVLNLQLVAEAMAAFDANSSDPLLNKKVQTFDFQGLVGAFDAARTATPGLSSWALSNGLTQFHLAGSDSEALGGDLAYHYGADGTLAGMGLGKAQDVLTNAQFGAQAQAIHSTASLQEGLIRLG